MNKKEEILGILRQSGWVENNSYPRDFISSTIREEGYPVFNSALDFLQIFFNTIIYFENGRKGLKNDDIDFFFEKATHMEVPERVNGSYSERIGKELCLICSVYRGHMVLMMSEDGCVYGGYDDFLSEIAKTGLGAVEAIIYDHDFVEVL